MSKPLNRTSNIKSMPCLERCRRNRSRNYAHRLGVDNDYEAYQFLEQPKSLKFLGEEKQRVVEDIRNKYEFFPGKFQGAETIQRYSYIQDLLNDVLLKHSDTAWKKNSVQLDSILLHKVWGYVIFFAILFLDFSIHLCLGAGAHGFH